MKTWLARKTYKKVLYLQIGEYLDWKLLSRGSDTHRDWLYRFAQFTKARSLQGISDREVGQFILSQNGVYGRMAARKALSGLLKYRLPLSEAAENAIFDGMNLGGRPINFTAVKKVKQLRKAKISFRDIAKIMGSDVKQVYRWATYPVKESVDIR